MDPISIIALILVVLSTILSMVLRPKPVPPFAAGLSDFQVPTADDGRPIPVVWGTLRVKGPNVVWYGDLTAVPIPAPAGMSGGS